MEHLERLSKVLRYAGLNLTPQLLQVYLDANVRTLIDSLSTRLEDNPNLGLDEIDGIINDIQEAAAKQQVAEAAKESKGKSSKKPALEKA